MRTICSACRPRPVRSKAWRPSCRPADAKITFYETPPLAAYGYTGSNPNAPIFGSSTMAQQNGNKACAPYIGDADPIAAMASDLHNACTGVAGAFDAANPTASQVGVAVAGDAWVSAIDLGYAEQNPFLVNEPAGQVDLWDSDPLLACCTTPIGYHPSVYGDYLNALVLFGQITGIDPRTLLAEFDPTSSTSAASALGISAFVAQELSIAAERPLATAPRSRSRRGGVAVRGLGRHGPVDAKAIDRSDRWTINQELAMNH